MVWKMYVSSNMAVLGIYVNIRVVFVCVEVLQSAAVASEQCNLPCRITPSSFSGELQNVCRTVQFGNDLVSINVVEMVFHILKILMFSNKWNHEIQLRL